MSTKKQATRPPPSPKLTPMRQTKTSFTSKVVFGNNEQKKKYERLKQRSILPSLYVSTDTLDVLDMTFDVYDLLQTIDLHYYAQRAKYTYKEPTMEFLSSIIVDKETFSMRYRLCGQEFETSADDLNRALHFPLDGETEEQNDRSFRNLITDHPDRVSTRKLSHPALRYVHKFLSRNLLGRGATGTSVSETEFFFLQCMLQYPNPIKPNVGWFMISQLEHVANNPQPNGYITIGGVITMLAEAHGFDLSNLAPVDRCIHLDLALMEKFQLISKESIYSFRTKTLETVYYNLPFEGPKRRFPLNAPSIEPNNQSTWKLVDTNATDVHGDEEHGDGEQGGGEDGDGASSSTHACQCGELLERVKQLEDEVRKTRANTSKTNKLLEQLLQRNRSP